MVLLTMLLNAALLALGYYIVHLRGRVSELRAVIKGYEAQLRSRQSSSMMMRSKPGPKARVERPKTSRRDTNDLPRTGRQARIIIHNTHDEA